MRTLTAALLALLIAVSVPHVAQATGLPESDASEIRAGVTLLTQTFYKQLDRTLLAGNAREALLAYAHTHGAPTASLPPALKISTDGALIASLIKDVGTTYDATKLNDKTLTYVALAAMAKASGDKYTQFFTPDEYKAFQGPLEPGKISGIGVIFGIDDATKNAKVLYVVPNAPAEKAGLTNGDEIVRVDDKPTAGLAMEAISKLLRGLKGSQVQLSIARDGKAIAPVQIVRADVVSPTVFSKILPENIGYIYVSIFGGPTSEEFAATLAKLAERGAKAYVIDLRNNGGGYVNAAINISSHFVDSGPIVSVEEHGAKITTYDAADASFMVRSPVSVLVNHYTASASEITAAALQESGVATLVGTRTYGKGVVQTMTPFPDGSAIKITTARYLTPRNHDINTVGIKPDLTVEENANARFGEPDRDAQLRVAIEGLTKKIAHL